jgi:hypothetical protein
MASTTITTTAAHALRFAAAVGDAKGLTVPGTNTPRSATNAEVNAWLVEQAINLTKTYEDRMAKAAAQAADLITPTAS